MAESSVNRVWVSMDLGNFNVGRKVSAFFGGDTFDEVHGHLTAAFGMMAADQIIGHVGQLGSEEAFDNLKAGGVVGGSVPAAPSSTTPASADGPVCLHGPKQYKEGMSAKGKWRAWMCPAPKGTPGQCQPEWIK